MNGAAGSSADEWEHLFVSPWFTLLRIHDYVWKDKDLDLKSRDRLCGMLRSKMYEICYEQCKRVAL